MRPTRHQLKLEPDESAMERKGLSRRTVYTTTKRDGFTSPCLLGFYIWKGTESVSVWVWQSHCFSRCTFVRVHTACLRVSARITCTNGPIQPLIFCKKKTQKKNHTGVVNHLKGHEISEGHIFIIWSSPRKWLDIFLQSCAETEASGWDLDGKQKSDNRWLSVSKLDYWPWWKVTAYTVMYWSINVNYFYFLFHATLYLYSTTFQWDILYFQLNS